MRGSRTKKLRASQSRRKHGAHCDNICATHFGHFQKVVFFPHIDIIILFFKLKAFDASHRFLIIINIAHQIIN